MNRPYTVGITGGSGSGKTHFINSLSAQFKKDEMCLLSMDHYYKPLDQQTLDSKGIENFDLPDAIDRVAFKADILKLKKGEEVIKKEYTFNNPKVTPKMLTFKPAPILLIEGLFVQYYEEVDQELDLRIFIDAKDHLKLERRIRRDNEERDYDLADVLYRYERHAMPIYEQLIAPGMHQADFIIPNNSNFDTAVAILVGYFRQKLGIAN